MKRQPSLDVVRGIAILMVLVWHFLPRHPGTPHFLLFPTRLFWSGVDLFFVLSGFLIGGILLKNVGARNYFGVFYIRRAARIIPLYLLLLAGFALLLYIQPGSIRATYQRHLPFWSYLTFTQNFLYAFRNNFSDPWMDVTWSLAVEEQFYIFLSVLIWHTRKKSLVIITVILILLAPVLRSFSSSLQAYVLPLQRADSLMLGVLLALIWQSDSGKAFLYRHARIFRWLLVPLFLAAAFFTYQDINIGDVAGHFWLALLYGDMVVLAAVSDSRGCTLILSNGALEWLGLRSYGIYLFHLPVSMVVKYLLGRFVGPGIDQWLIVLISSGAIFLFAEICFHLIEKPLMESAHRFKYAF